MSDSSTNNEQKLIKTLNDMTSNFETMQQRNKDFKNGVKQRIEALNQPISNSIDYIRNLKVRIADLQKDIEGDLNENTREAIENARNKLAIFQSEIQTTSDLDTSLTALAQSVRDLEAISKDDSPNLGGGSKKRRRKIRRTRKKRNVRKHSNKIKYR
jgi:hypothetical protein